MGEAQAVMSDIYSLGLLTYFVITGKHAFDPKMASDKLLQAVGKGAEVELPGMKPELVGLIKSMVAVNPAERPESARAVFEVFCEHEFALVRGVDPAMIRSELAKFGVCDRFEPEMARVMREILALKAETERIGPLEQRIVALEARNERLMRLLPADKTLELRADDGEPEAQLELGGKLLWTEPVRARELLQKCPLPRAKELLAPPKCFVGSMAEPWAKQLWEWRPQMKGTTLLAKDAGSGDGVRAFMKAAWGHAHTFVFVETVTGGSICGGFLNPAWKQGRIDDPTRESFLFTLKKHLAIPPTKFPKNGDKMAAVCDPGYFRFGWSDGICVKTTGTDTGKLGTRYEDAVGKGEVIFHGGDPRWARWELWETK
jgi:hypothetical protein